MHTVNQLKVSARASCSNACHHGWMCLDSLDYAFGFIMRAGLLYFGVSGETDRECA